MSDGGPAVRRLADWPAARLRALADAHGTPLYVFDLGRVRENYRRFAAAFSEARVYYAAKANAHHATLDALHEEGAGVECASAGEVRRALDAGVPADEIRYTAVNPPDGDLDRVVGWGVHVTAGAKDTVARLADRGFTGPLGIRVNPGVGAGHHGHVRTGGDAKFGVPHEDAHDAIRLATDRGIRVTGLHAHAGSGLMTEDLDAHRRLVERLAALAVDAPVTIEEVDVGGGFGVPSHPDEAPLDLDAVATATRDALGDLDATLLVEPGRYLVADAGVLVCRVNTVKDTTPAIVGVDAGMTTLLRPALYGAYHHLRTLAVDAEERADRTVTVTGPICESADVLGEDRDLPAPARGDLLAVGTAGAYGYEMASQYNSRPRPAVVAIEGDRDAVIRDREGIDDVARGEHGVPWP